MKKQLKDLKRGETFYGAGIQWTVLDHSRSSQGLPLRTFVVSTDITENRAFDEGNKCDFAASTLRAYLNGEFLRKLEDELGAGNICEYVIDLTADDGLPKYGKDSAKVGLLTMEDYRRHRDILPPIGKWWWTATPYSGLDDYNSYVRGVNTDGSSNNNNAYNGNNGVRPALVEHRDQVDRRSGGRKQRPTHQRNEYPVQRRNAEDKHMTPTPRSPTIPRGPRGYRGVWREVYVEQDRKQNFD